MDGVRVWRVGGGDEWHNDDIKTIGVKQDNTVSPYLFGLCIDELEWLLSLSMTMTLNKVSLGM